MNEEGDAAPGEDGDGQALRGEGEERGRDGGRESVCGLLPVCACHSRRQPDDDVAAVCWIHPSLSLHLSHRLL